MLVQKSSKNLPKIVQKSRSGGSKIEVQRVQILPKSSSGEGFGRLGGVLGVSWGVLGCLWVSWVRLGASCGRPWGVLGRLGSKKVANMAPTWSPKRSQNREKIEAKNRSKILMALGVGFLKDFGGFGWVKWSQVGT